MVIGVIVKMTAGVDFETVAGGPVTSWFSVDSRFSRSIRDRDDQSVADYISDQINGHFEDRLRGIPSEEREQLFNEAVDSVCRYLGELFGSVGRQDDIYSFLEDIPDLCEAEEYFTLSSDESEEEEEEEEDW